MSWRPKHKSPLPRDSTDTFLLQYLANGGSLNPTEHPAQDTSIMQGILDYYQRARANGNLSENTSLMNSSNQVYPLFSTHQVPIAQVQASDFMLDRSRMQSALAAAVPTRDGHATSLVSGWSYVILTNDPARHQAAAAYLAWLDDPERLGAWAVGARMIPASKSAFAASRQAAIVRGCVVDPFGARHSVAQLGTASALCRGVAHRGASSSRWTVGAGRRRLSRNFESYSITDVSA